MAAILVSQALSEMRTFLRDKNSNAPAFTDAQGIVLLNLGMLWWSENMERRTMRFTRTNPIPWVGTTEWTAGLLSQTTQLSGDPTKVSEFIEVGLDGLVAVGSASSTIPLERMEWADLRMRQHNTILISAQPTHWSVLRLANSNDWQFALYPIPNNESTGPAVGWKLVGIARVQPVVLTATTDTIDLGDSEVRSVILLAAILMAPLINKPELGEHFKTLLPERVREKMETTKVHDEATV